MPIIEDAPRPISKYNPATGGLLYDVQPTIGPEFESRLEAARRAQIAWKNAPITERARVLKRIHSRLLDEAERFAHIITQEVGKPLPESAQTDIMTALIGTQHAMARGKAIFKPQFKQSLKGLMLGRVYKQLAVPHGVVAIISPWNYPLGTPMPAIAGALMAGNSVAFKPSEKTPRCGEALVEIIREALEACGHSPEIIQLFEGDGRVGEALVNALETRFVFFTGSVAVGQRIQQTCARLNKPCSLELGGSDAMIILPSAERYSLDAITSHALWGRFTNAGQTCSAIKRLYVPRTLLPVVKELLSAKLLQLKTGDPRQPDTHMGPMIDTRQREALRAQVEEAVSQGAALTQKPLDIPPVGEQAFIAPALLTNLPMDARVLNEETFGPALPLLPYDDLAQVVEDVNSLPYGLGASIFGKPKQAEWLAKHLEVANVAINDLHMMFYAMPQLGWRGWKASGPGVRMADEGLMQFCRVQTLGKSVLFGVLPAMNKPPWLFQKGAGLTLEDVMPLVEAMAGPKWWNLFSPQMLSYLKKASVKNKL